MPNSDEDELERRVWALVLTRMVEQNRTDGWAAVRAEIRSAVASAVAETEQRLSSQIAAAAAAAPVASADPQPYSSMSSGAGVSHANADAYRRNAGASPDRARLNLGVYAGVFLAGAAVASAAWFAYVRLSPPPEPAPGAASTSPAPPDLRPASNDFATGAPPPVNPLDAPEDRSWRLLLENAETTRIVCDGQPACARPASLAGPALGAALQAAGNLARTKLACAGRPMAVDGDPGPGTIASLNEVLKCADTNKACAPGVCELPKTTDAAGIAGAPGNKLLTELLKYLASNS